MQLFDMHQDWALASDRNARYLELKNFNKMIAQGLTNSSSLAPLFPYPVIEKTTGMRREARPRERTLKLAGPA